MSDYRIRPATLGDVDVLIHHRIAMFRNQAEIFKDKQWAGWKLFLNVFIRRESVRAAWALSKTT